MEVINFDKKSELTKETTVTIYWIDEDPIEIQVTAFGNAEGSRRMLVFYNDNISEAPILIANEEYIKYVELSPLFTPEAEADEIAADYLGKH